MQEDLAGESPERLLRASRNELEDELLRRMPPSAENDCPCGRGPGHVRIKAAGCTPSAENDVEARMARVSDEAVRVAEEVWTEDEPTLAEYELTEAILRAAGRVTPPPRVQRFEEDERDVIVYALQTAVADGWIPAGPGAEIAARLEAEFRTIEHGSPPEPEDDTRGMDPESRHR